MLAQASERRLLRERFAPQRRWGAQRPKRTLSLARSMPVIRSSRTLRYFSPAILPPALCFSPSALWVFSPTLTPFCSRFYVSCSTSVRILGIIRYFRPTIISFPHGATISGQSAPILPIARPFLRSLPHFPPPHHPFQNKKRREGGTFRGKSSRGARFSRHFY